MTVFIALCYASDVNNVGRLRSAGQTAAHLCKDEQIQKIPLFAFRYFIFRVNDVVIIIQSSGCSTSIKRFLNTSFLRVRGRSPAPTRPANVFYMLSPTRAHQVLGRE